tara:strand:+ start:220 stop:1395 length:1176 start_codon:yes stop_codon:yes gene_type:complete
MSTLLIDTTGGSKFNGSSSLVDSSTKVGGAVQNTSVGSVSLTNTDGKPELKSIRQVIDVVNDFSWYAGPKATSAALDKVPCVFLTEREQLLSSLMSGALYYLNASADAIQNVGGQVVGSNYVQSILGKISEGSKDILEGSGSAANGLIDQFKGFTSGNASDRQLLEQHNLKSLAGIYFTKPTGFNYRLPIYGAPTHSTGSWDEGSDESAVSTIVGMGTKLADNIAKSVNFAQPGVYIEQPKYFKGVGTREESITFPLLNSVRRGTHSPIQQNYELLWLLAFQNSAYKTSFARTPPPKIYTVSVPGQFSMPYAYISGMDVKFMGTVRKSTVFVPSGNGEGTISSKKITTPVPDAYQVTLKFKSLVSDYGNIMLSDAFNTSIENNKVTVGGSK